MPRRRRTHGRAPGHRRRRVGPRDGAGRVRPDGRVGGRFAARLFVTGPAAWASRPSPTGNETRYDGTWPRAPSRDRLDDLRAWTTATAPVRSGTLRCHRRDGHRRAPIARRLQNATILIRDGRIAAVGPSASTSSAARCRRPSTRRGSSSSRVSGTCTRTSRRSTGSRRTSPRA